MTNSIAHPRRRREHALAAILVSVFILIFLGTPLARYRTSLYTPADLTQMSSLTRVDAEHHVANPALGDVVVQMESWLLFGREEIRQGRVPLWNPYNGGGTPFLANYQSAVFSPFSVPYYVLSLKNALLVAAFLKLFCLGFATYFFLREIELVFLAAMTGAVAFMFAGYNVLLLGYPHSAAMVTLPLALFFAERALRRFERAPRATLRPPARGRRGPLSAVGAMPFLGLAVALVVGLLSGQPEPFYFATLFVCVFIAARLIGIWLRSRRDFAALREIGSLAGSFLLVGALAAGIAAIQLVPFFEYASLSRVLVQRSHEQVPLSLVIWPLLFFPNLLGNPSTNYNVSDSLPPPDFETANLVYSGGIVMLLALISLLFVRRNRHHAFFVFAALAWFIYAYDIAGVWRAFSVVPSVEIAPINRSQALWEFCLACCAAFGVHHLVHVRVPVRSMLFASTLFAGVVMLTTFLFGAQHLAVQAYAQLKATPGREAIYEYSMPHIVHVSLAFLPGILALSVMLLAPQGRLRRLLTAVVLISVFLQTGYLFKNYNPVSEERFVFPMTQAVKDLAEFVGANYVAVLGDDTLIPDTNIVYRIAMPASYDALWIDRYDKLYRETFGEGNNWRPMRRATLHGLELFGVDYVLSKGDWLDVDTLFGEIPDNPRALYEGGEILPGNDMVQTFTCTEDRLQAIRVFAGSLGHIGACTLRLTLEDPRDGRAIAMHDFDCRMLPVDAASKTPLVFEFEPIADSRGRAFRLRASSPDAREGAGVSLWCRSDWKHWVNVALWRASVDRSLVPSDEPAADHERLDAWRLALGKILLEGGLDFDFATSRAAFRSLRPIGEHTLYKIENSPSRFHLVSRAIPVENDEQAFARVQSRDFDPRVSVVLDRRDVEDAASSHELEEPSAVYVLDEQPTRIRMKLDRPHAGWLVIAKPWYPGWIARVDGEQREIHSANYAFSAVHIATGESQVELEYDPPSFRRGLWITALSSVSLVLFLGLLAWRSRLGEFAN